MTKHLRFVLFAALVMSSHWVHVSAIGQTSQNPRAVSPEAGRVEVNGVTLAFESFGAHDRETILLIAGTGQQLTSWPPELVEALVAQGYRVVRFDNRDAGLSTHLDATGLPDAAAITKALEAGEPAPLPYTLQDMAEDAVGLLDALRIDQAHVVGISMGGAIAQLVAIDFPQRTRSLTSIMADSGNPALPVIAKPEAFAKLPPPSAGDVEAFIDYQVKVFQILSSPDYPTDEKTLRAWVERDVARAYDPDALVRQQTASLVGHFDGYRLERLRTIRVPTVVLQGAADPLVPVASAKDVAARVPGAELRVIPGLGHDIPAALVPVFVDAITGVAAKVTHLP